MNFSEPLTILLITPIILLTLFFLKELIRGNGASEFNSKWFSFKKNNTEQLIKEIEELKNEVKRLRSDIDFRHSKDDVKYEYRSKLAKILKKYETLILEKIEQEYLTKKREYTISQIRSLDEYKLILGQIGMISRTMVIKAMDDFDKNGFDKIGLDADGKFDYKLLVNYLSEKPKEYEIEVKKFFMNSDYPLTLIDISVIKCDKELHSRLVVLDVGFIESVVLSCLFSVSDDISSLYEFTITKMKLIHEESTRLDDKRG